MTDADTGQLSERQYWEQEATKLRRTGLSDIRARAEKWETTIGTLLGVLGVVAFVEGPDKIGDFERTAQWALIVGIGVAAALAVSAIILAALAAQGIPKQFRVLTGARLASQSAKSAKNAISFLYWSRVLAIAATAALIVGALTAWAVGLEKNGDDKVKAVVVTADGAVHCGSLKGQGVEGIALDEGGETALSLAADVAQVQVVSACPKTE